MLAMRPLAKRWCIVSGGARIAPFHKYQIDFLIGSRSGRAHCWPPREFVGK